MSRKRAQRRTPVTKPTPLDPETGLPPVGKALPSERDDVLARARAKHRHRKQTR